MERDRGMVGLILQRMSFAHFCREAGLKSACAHSFCEGQHTGAEERRKAKRMGAYAPSGCVGHQWVAGERRNTGKIPTFEWDSADVRRGSDESRVEG